MPDSAITRPLCDCWQLKGNGVYVSIYPEKYNTSEEYGQLNYTVGELLNIGVGKYGIDAHGSPPTEMC